MKSDKAKFFLCLLFFTVLAMITFRCVFGADRVFSASDVNIGGLAVRQQRGLDLFLGFFSSRPVLGTSGYSLSLFNLLVALIPLELFANSFYGLMLVTGSVSMLWFLRMQGRSWMASVFGALVSFWINSILLAHVGHVYKIEVLVFSVVTLCLIEKAVREKTNRKSMAYSMLAGISVGIMLLEQQDVALLAGLFVGPYALFRLAQFHGRDLLRWCTLLAPLAIVAWLISGSTLIKSYEDNIANAASVQGDDNAKWNYVTQWSAVPEEWPDLVALGWGGWSTGNPKGPYWGKLGRSAEWETTGQGFQNFKLNSVYFGIIPFLLGGFGLAAGYKNRKGEEGQAILFWSIVGLAGLWLAFGKYSLLYKLFYHLPLFSNIRAPIKLLDNFQICLGIVGAYGLDSMLANGNRNKLVKVFWMMCAAISGLMLFGGFKVLIFPAGWMDKFAQYGYKPHSGILLECMSHAWLHAGVLALLCGGLAFAVWRGVRQSRWWMAVGLVALMTADSLILTSHHFTAIDIAGIKRGNQVINYLKEHQGNERIFFVDQSGIYNQWLAVDCAFHDLNMFNIWQMNRMPSEYSEFLGTVGSNKIRIWELAAVRYVAAPVGIMQQLKQNPELGNLFEPVLGYQVPTAQGMRQDVILEFKGYIPRFSFYRNWTVLPSTQHCESLASAKHDPHARVLVTPESGLSNTAGHEKAEGLQGEISASQAVVKVNAVSGGILRFSQRFEPTWKVFVDGKKADLLKLDYLCMGVYVPEGEHDVEFRCNREVGAAATSFLTILIAALSAGFLLASKKRA